jgi:hypothetical protein
VRVFNLTPYPGDQIGRVVAWTAMTLPLREDWPVSVGWMTTDWWDYHTEGGIAYPDRRGAFIYLPRVFISTPQIKATDPWEYIVEVGAHEMRHLLQFEEHNPGSSAREPEPEADESDESTARNAVLQVTGTLEDPDTLRAAVESAKKSRAALEALCDAAAAERLHAWKEELAPFERDSVRFGQLELPTHWE